MRKGTCAVAGGQGRSASSVTQTGAVLGIMLAVGVPILAVLIVW